MKNELLYQLEQRKNDRDNHKRTKSVIKNYRSIEAEPRVMNNSSSVVNDVRHKRGGDDMYALISPPDYGAKQKNPSSMMESYALAKPQSYVVKP